MKNISQIMYNTFYECSLEQSVFLSFKSPQKLAFIKLKIFWFVHNTVYIHDFIKLFICTTRHSLGPHYAAVFELSGQISFFYFNTNFFKLESIVTAEIKCSIWKFSSSFSRLIWISSSYTHKMFIFHWKNNHRAF